MTAVAYLLEVRNAAADPATITLEPGTPLEPTSFGRTAMWRIDATEVMDVHGYVYFDGQSLYVQSADNRVPVLLNDRRVGTSWTEVRPPAAIRVGRAEIRAKRVGGTVEPGAAIGPAPYAEATDRDETRYAPIGAGDASPSSPPVGRMPPPRPAASRPPSRPSSRPSSRPEPGRRDGRGASGRSTAPPAPTLPQAGSAPQTPPVPPPPRKAPAATSLAPTVPRMRQSPPPRVERGAFAAIRREWSAMSTPRRAAVLLVPPIAIALMIKVFGGAAEEDEVIPAATASALAAPSAPPPPAPEASAPSPPAPEASAPPPALSAPLAPSAPPLAPSAPVLAPTVPLPPTAAVPAVPPTFIQQPPAVPQPQFQQPMPQQQPQFQQPVPQQFPPQPQPVPQQPAPRTMEQSAADALMAGNLPLALQLYDELARINPQDPTFAETARMIRARLAATPPR